MMGTDLSTIPHSLDHEVEYLNVGILNQNKNVVVVTLDRRGKRNAVNAKMWKEIGYVFSRLGRSGDGCRAILLTGAGKDFCAGIDVMDPLFQMAAEDDVARSAISFMPKILEMQQCLTTVEKCPVPVICAVHGNCIGAGIDLACCADVRLSSLDAIFSVREVRVGLAADVGTLQRLPKIVGHSSRVRELCLTGSNFDASEAHRIGFISRVASVNLVGDALKLCCDIAALSPVAVTSTKTSLNYSRDHTVQEGLEHIALHNSIALQSEDLIKSFTMDGEKPNFVELLPHSKL
eukprot:CAMPEP_0178937024 /NCGR_PEP_ID=MMETSP0786-20121207/25511_1 /TAXON_ID=186022 /ORGANISM="Thalassionema frauenfeldii, Strain CCMP 1798" /LENGTH=290 /DNA_ID=CAMNT_0020615517 /DNA_START=338 /DNA_END=1210 /DNA_ORIENTATION=+